MSNFYAIVPAAGTGSRFGGPQPKQYALLNGIAVIRRAVGVLLADPRIRLIVVAVHASDQIASQVLAEECASGRVKVIGCGGETRAKTVRNALTAVIGNGATKTDWVLVHDAARPGLPFEALQRLMHLSQTDVIGGLLALPVVDTIKRAGKDHHASIAETLPREGLWQAQTPQMFRVGQLTNAVDGCLRNSKEPTDEAQAMEHDGHLHGRAEGEDRLTDDEGPPDRDVPQGTRHRVTLFGAKGHIKLRRDPAESSFVVHGLLRPCPVCLLLSYAKTAPGAMVCGGRPPLQTSLQLAPKRKHEKHRWWRNMTRRCMASVRLAP